MRLWDAATGKELKSFKHDQAVTSVALSPDGRTAASGTANNIARLWYVADGKELARLPHDQDVTAVAFHPGGRILATGSKNDSARLWEVASGLEIATMRHGCPVTAVTFSHDGRFVLTGTEGYPPGGELGAVRLWPLGQQLLDHACARVHELPLADEDKRRLDIDDEWCTPEKSEALRHVLDLVQAGAKLRSAR